MYYRLSEDVELRSYQGFPYGIHLNTEGKTYLIPSQEDYLLLFRCSGRHDLSAEMLTDGQKKFLRTMVDRRLLLESPVMNPMLHAIPHREFPCRYYESIHWSLTGKCNFCCQHCFQSAPDGILGEPDTDKCLEMIRQFAECGIDRVDITGGEPLIRTDLPQIISALCKNHIHIGCIFSNGWLINETLLSMLKEYPIKPTFQLSFDGVGWHDWMRGVPGAEERTVDAMKLLKKNGFTFGAAMCLCRENADVIMRTVRLLDSLGCQGMKIQRAMPQGKWLNKPEHYLEDSELLNIYLSAAQAYMTSELQMDLQMEGVFSITSKSGKKRIRLLFDTGSEDEKTLRMPSCDILLAHFFLGPNGAVVPCMSMCGSPIEKQFPNAFETPLKDILSESNLISLSRTTSEDVLNHNSECTDCPYRIRCRGGKCRACAVGSSGEDFLAVDRFVCSLFKSGWSDKLSAFAESFGPAEDTGTGGIC